MRDGSPRATNFEITVTGQRGKSGRFSAGDSAGLFVVNSAKLSSKTRQGIAFIPPFPAPSSSTFFTTSDAPSLQRFQLKRVLARIVVFPHSVSLGREKFYTRNDLCPRSFTRALTRRFNDRKTENKTSRINLILRGETFGANARRLPRKINELTGRNNIRQETTGTNARAATYSPKSRCERNLLYASQISSLSFAYFLFRGSSPLTRHFLSNDGIPGILWSRKLLEAYRVPLLH